VTDPRQRSTAGVLAEFTELLVRDGYAGYEHLQACTPGAEPTSCAICGRSPTPTRRQLWAPAMATTLLDANVAAHAARERGTDRLDRAT